MDFVFWIILIVLIVGVVWWLLNRSSSANTSDAGSRAGGMRTDGALEGGSAAASADAAATTGIAGAAGFGRPAEPTPPTTADEAPELSTSPGWSMRDAEPVPHAPTGGPADSPSHSPTVRGNEETDGGNEEIDGGTRTTGATPDAEGETWAEAETGSPAQETGPGLEDARVEEDAGLEEDARLQEEARRQAEKRREEDAAEWETQWSEASGSTAVPRTEAPQGDLSPGSDGEPSGAAAPVHNPEYTGPHSPTLPGAETAALEDADAGAMPAEKAGAGVEGRRGEDTATAGSMAQPEVPDNAAATETLDRTQSSAAVETSASHTAEPPEADAERAPGSEPSSHLDAEEPYGQGSASPAPDGSGPADYTVKGDAATMTYYEEGHPDYEQTRAGVWFESPAHAEAAGFRAPRRKRL
ncbi:hypothetical protein M1E17_14845 [Arthrobacter sp. D1-29]